MSQGCPGAGKWHSVEFLTPKDAILFSVATGGTKRKGSSKTDQQARKKPRQKAEPLDEATMVALALSSSLLQQQKEAEQRAAQVEVVSATPELKWRPDAGASSSSLSFSSEVSVRDNWMVLLRQF